MSAIPSPVTLCIKHANLAVSLSHPREMRPRLCVIHYRATRDAHERSYVRDVPVDWNLSVLEFIKEDRKRQRKKKGEREREGKKRRRKINERMSKRVKNED